MADLHGPNEYVLDPYFSIYLDSVMWLKETEIGQNLTLVLKNVIKLAKGLHNNIFRDSFNKILSKQLTQDRSYISTDRQNIFQ